MQSTGQKSTQTSHPVQDGLTTAISTGRRFFPALLGISLTIVSLIACSEFDLDILAIHACRIRPHRAPAGRAKQFARTDAELGPVPGTHHAVPFDLPFRQRPAPVIAGVINGVVAAVQIEDGKAPTRDIYALGLAGTKVAGLDHFDKRRHGVL
jgi:hypothetical protein